MEKEEGIVGLIENFKKFNEAMEKFSKESAKKSSEALTMMFQNEDFKKSIENFKKLSEMKLDIEFE